MFALLCEQKSAEVYIDCNYKKYVLTVIIETFNLSIQFIKVKIITPTQCLLNTIHHYAIQYDSTISKLELI